MRAQGVEVRDVEPREVLGLVGPRLPDVVPEDLPRGPEDDVRRGMVGHQGAPPRVVDFTGHAFPEEALAMSRLHGFDEAFCGWIYHRMLFDSWVLTSTALARREVFET